MKSVVTSKFQTTIPKAIRESLKLSVNDTIDWEIQDGKAVVSPAKKPFMQYQNVIKVGPGSIRSDIDEGRKHRAKELA